MSLTKELSLTSSCTSHTHSCLCHADRCRTELLQYPLAICGRRRCGISMPAIVLVLVAVVADSSHHKTDLTGEGVHQPCGLHLEAKHVALASAAVPGMHVPCAPVPPLRFPPRLFLAALLASFSARFAQHKRLGRTSDFGLVVDIKQKLDPFLLERASGDRRCGGFGKLL